MYFGHFAIAAVLKAHKFEVPALPLSRSGVYGGTAGLCAAA